MEGPAVEAHRSFARALYEHGVDTLFGLMGDANMLHITDYVDETGGRFVSAVEEGSAVSMADGFHRTSGKVGVATVTHGPAATNCATALTEAVRARSAVVLICGDPIPRRDHIQAINLSALAHVAGARYHEVRSAEHIAEDIARVLAEVAVSRTPVLFNLPAATQMAEVDHPAAARTRAKDIIQAPAADEDALDTALGVLASARRPIVLAGSGAMEASARDDLIALADLIGAPMATTWLAKDLFTGHPWDLGVMGTVGSQIGLQCVSKADCIIAFGAGLNDFTTDAGSLLEGKALIHCDIDPRRLVRVRPTVAPVVGDARQVARAMVERLRASDHRPSSFRTDELRASLAKYAPTDDFEDTSTDVSIDMRTAMVRLDEMLPRKRVVATDGGRFMKAPMRYLSVRDPRSILHTANFGSIGLGIPTAVGAAIGAPDRVTVAVVGDGGGMMRLIELSTAVRFKLPLVVVVLNDACYGMEYHTLSTFGVDPQYALCHWPEFADVARSLGARAYTARNLNELDSLHDELAKIDGPVLIDVKADPAVDIDAAHQSPREEGKG
jgi:thiamine pyrophosphate-dependent acetolactate synthase large subunit-like protein